MIQTEDLPNQVIIWDHFLYKKLFVHEKYDYVSKRGETHQHWRIVHQPEFGQWCLENIKGKVIHRKIDVDFDDLDRKNQLREEQVARWRKTQYDTTIHPTRRSVLSFEEVNDAILFKLRWL